MATYRNFIDAVRAVDAKLVSPETATNANIVEPALPLFALG